MTTLTLSAERLNQITSAIIAAAIRVHRALGPGLLESAYRACLCYELRQQGLQIETEKPLVLIYRDIKIDRAYCADIVVEMAVIVEVKAVERLPRIAKNQLHTYLKLADCRVGLIMNFGMLRMADGIERVVNKFPDS